MNKREFGISRIVGVEESVEQEILDYFKEEFKKDRRGAIEREHSPELIDLIREINEKMKEFVANYGVQFLEITSRNIYIIDRSKLSPEEIVVLEEKLKEKLEEGTNGFYSPSKQLIVILESYEPNNKLNFAKVLIHEMLHANSFVSMQKVNKGEVELHKGEKRVNLDVRRAGFMVNSAKAKKSFSMILKNRLPKS